MSKERAAAHLDLARKAMEAMDYRFAIAWLYHAVLQLIDTDEPEASGHGPGIQSTHPAAERSVVDAPGDDSSVSLTSEAR